MEINNQKCIIFDFDCTLTIIHLSYLVGGQNYQNQFQKIPMWMEILQKNNTTVDEFRKIIFKDDWSGDRKLIIDVLFGGPERLGMLHNLMQELDQSGFDIFISSRGNYLWICKVLMFVGLNVFIKEINAGTMDYPECKIPFVLATKEGKYKYISEKMRKVKLVCYIDDDNSEFLNFKFNINPQLFPDLEKFIYFGDFIYVYKKYPDGPVQGDKFSLLKNHTGLTQEMIETIKKTVFGLIGGYFIPYYHKYIKYKTKYFQLLNFY